MVSPSGIIVFVLENLYSIVLAKEGNRALWSTSCQKSGFNHIIVAVRVVSIRAMFICDNFYVTTIFYCVDRSDFLFMKIIIVALLHILDSEVRYVSLLFTKVLEASLKEQTN